MITATARAVPILMYHQVAPESLPAFHKYTVTPKAFAAQMRWLALAGYTPITLDDLFTARRGGGRLPPRPVIITFDDGFQSCVDYAAPILKARGFRATFYLVAGLMGQVSEWLIAERGIELALISWATARQLEAAGFQCGAHSLSHPHLVKLDAAACRAELYESRLLLEERLGRPVRHLAYPFGSFNETVRYIAAESGYLSACSTRIGLSPADDDLLALHRIHVTGQDSLLDFICRLHTAHSCREVARRIPHAALQRLRRAKAST